MTTKITLIDTAARRDVNRFIELPFRLYQGCAPWVPPLLDDIKLMLNRREYPFYQHSNADFFVAERDGQVVGRIAVLENRHYNAHWGSHAAFFYLFDAENDAEVGQALFAAAENWAKSRNLTKMVGAKGFLQGDGIGVLIDGFEHHPAVGIPYNHPYYAALIEDAGYRRQRDFYSAYLPGNTDIPGRVRSIAEKMMARRGFTIKTFTDKKELSAWVPHIVQLYNDAFVDNWEFNPITEAEARVIGERLLAIADPKLIKLVMKGDEIAGFLFGFPDISEGIRRARGRIWPIGWFWLLRDMRRTKWINLNGAGILAPYRGLGVNAILYAEMEKTIQSGGFEHADIVQIEEKVLTLADTRTMGGEIYKTHRIYEKDLT
jgi:GNAT superfamily N-acetyltransferase